MKAYSLDLRQKIIDVYNQGNISQRRLAKQFSVALSFIQKLLKQDRQTGQIAPQIRIKQTPTKLNCEQIRMLEELVNTNKDATLEELRHKIASELGVVISRSTVDRMLNRLNWTLKKTLHATEKGTEKVQKQRLEFWKIVRSILVKDLIFLDESGVNLGWTRLFARSHQGQRASGERPHQRGQNVSIISAMSFQGILAQSSLMGGTDAVTFEAFISQKLVPKLWKGS